MRNTNPCTKHIKTCTDQNFAQVKECPQSRYPCYIDGPSGIYLGDKPRNISVVPPLTHGLDRHVQEAFPSALAASPYNAPKDPCYLIFPWEGFPRAGHTLQYKLTLNDTNSSYLPCPVGVGQNI